MEKLSLKKKFQLNLFRNYRCSLTKIHELNYLFWECTLKCNLNCIHCGSDCTQNSSLKNMPLSDFLTVLKSLKNHVNSRKTLIAITGGEPLLRQNLAECGKAITRLEYPWGMVSNGYALTSEKLDELLRSGLGSLTISLDGLEDSHNWLRGKSDSYRRALTAIENAAQEKKLVFDVVTCVNQKNFDELGEIRELLVEKKVRAWRLFTIFPKGRAKENPLLDISNKQFATLMDFIKETREQGRIQASYGCEGFLGSYEAEVRDSFFFCRAGISVGSVLADGSISACPSLRGDYIQGNIYSDDFYDVWQNRFQKMRNRKWLETGICADCRMFKYCEGNGLHLRDEQTGELLRCQYNMLKDNS